MTYLEQYPEKDEKIEPMEFTFHAYENLVSLLQEHGYSITDYHDWEAEEKCAILRHDIDYDPKKAAEMAKLERKIGIRSTYFVMLTSEFYNVFSGECCEQLNVIAENGHEIGLHFDEVRYPQLIGNEDAVREIILEECHLLEAAIGTHVSIVSMHRPSKAILESDLAIPGIINSYGSVFFKGFKYLSDSRRRWREPVEEIICSEQYARLHILTHAFWYEEIEKSLHDSVCEFVNRAGMDRYHSLSENISDIDSIMREYEVAGGA